MFMPFGSNLTHALRGHGNILKLRVELAHQSSSLPCTSTECSREDGLSTTLVVGTNRRNNAFCTFTVYSTHTCT